MLYKKIHRQHVRQWRVGREFTARYYDGFCRLKVIGKPEVGKIVKHCIIISCSDSRGNISKCVLIPRTGCFYFKDITWLD